MTYYLLNINFDKNSEVDYWLNDRQIAPIFYGATTIDQISLNTGHSIPAIAYRDAISFVQTFKVQNNKAIIFSIGNKDLYIFKQASPLSEIEYHKGDLVKGFRIHLLKKIPIGKCPLVLTSIKANRYMASGTFKPLNGLPYLGNIKALEYLLSGKKITVDNIESYFWCLSSLEFETLVAKYLEEKGFFVPAYKGGFIRNYDLFCRNIQESSITIGDLHISPSEVVSVQVKLRLNRKNYNEYAQVFFCLQTEIEKRNILDYNFLNNELAKYPSTNNWLKQTLDWVDYNNCT